MSQLPAAHVCILCTLYDTPEEDMLVTVCRLDLKYAVHALVQCGMPGSFVF